MKQSFLILLLILLTNLFVGAQSVTNVSFEKSGKQVVISYDLSGEPGSTWNINIYCNRAGDKTWGTPLQKLTGAYGNAISPDTNKKVTWDVLSEMENLEGQISFLIEATEIISPKIDPPIVEPIFPPEYYKYKKSKTIWLVSAMVTVGIGAFTYLQTGTTYTQYQSATADADALHSKADLYNKIAPIALGIAGICTLEFIIKAGKQSKAKKEKKLTFYPQQLFRGGGVALAYTF
jgi:hypothetical protein